jgi:hypothetical protein
MKKPFVVGHTINRTIRRARFATHDEAAAFIGNVINKRDPEGVTRGDYYLDGPEEIVNPATKVKK